MWLLTWFLGFWVLHVERTEFPHIPANSTTFPHVFDNCVFTEMIGTQHDLMMIFFSMLFGCGFHHIFQVWGSTCWKDRIPAYSRIFDSFSPCFRQLCFYWNDRDVAWFDDDFFSMLFGCGFHRIFRFGVLHVERTDFPHIPAYSTAFPHVFDKCVFTIVLSFRHQQIHQGCHSDATRCVHIVVRMFHNALLQVGCASSLQQCLSPGCWARIEA